MCIREHVHEFFFFVHAYDMYVVRPNPNPINIKIT